MTRALSRGKPDIINSDQGSHVTCPTYIELLEKNGVKLSMDGKGRCRDNARTERFFHSLKYERLYLNEYETPRHLRAMVNEYIQTYNTARPHSALGGQTPIFIIHTMKITNLEKELNLFFEIRVLTKGGALQNPT